jgi:hypothetical protein
VRRWSLWLVGLGVLAALVVYDSTGQAETVRYHVLPAMLLNESNDRSASSRRCGKSSRSSGPSCGVTGIERSRLAGLRGHRAGNTFGTSVPPALPACN